ncbi:hypothetical protein D3C84_486350 [compost metagenome]
MMVGYPEKRSIGKSRAELPEATIKTGPFLEPFARSNVIGFFTLSADFCISQLRCDFQSQALVICDDASETFYHTPF